MEVLAFFLSLYFRVILLTTANGNTLPLAMTSSQIEPFKVLPPEKEGHIINNFLINEQDFLQSPNTLPKIENGVAKSEILLEDAASPFLPSITNSFLNFEGNSAVKDFSTSISQSVGSTPPPFGCNSFTNFSGDRCMSNFKASDAFRDSIEAYANLISSSNSVFKLPMAIQSSGDSISKPFDTSNDCPFDSFTTPGSFDVPQPPCVQDTKSPHLSFFNFTNSCPSYSHGMFPAIDFPRAKATCEFPLVSHSSDLFTHAPCAKSFDTVSPDFGLVSDSCQSCSQSVLPLLDFPRNLETCQSPLISSSRSTIPVFDFPIESGQSPTLSQCTSTRNCLPTVSSLSQVNLSPNFLKFDSFPSFSSSSAFSLPITVNCIDCKSCSLSPLPSHSPTFSMIPVQKMIEDCIVSTPNTVAPPILPMSSSCSVCRSPMTVSLCSPPIFDSLLTDDLISNDCPKVPTASSLPLSTDLGSCMISVKNLLPSLNEAYSNTNSLSSVPLALPSSLPKLQLATTSFPLLPKPHFSLYNNSNFEIPDISNRVSIFDNMFQSLNTPVPFTHFSTNVSSLPSANILTPHPLAPSFSCLTPSSMIPIPSSLSSNYLPSTALDLPTRYKEPISSNICDTSIVSDQTAINERKSDVLKNNIIGDGSFLNEILSMICQV